jgi:hypothetical protein
MTTNLLSVIEQLVGALEALHYDIGTINQQHGLSEAALAAGKQALEQTQGEAWKHSCNVLCVDRLELWIDHCPHCGKPAPSHPQASEPAPSTAGEVDYAWKVKSEPNQPAQGDRAEAIAVLNGYVNSYRTMGKIGDGRVACSAVAMDIERNILPIVRAALLSAPALPVGELTDKQLRSIAEAVGNEMWPDNGDVGWTDDDTKFHRLFFERALAAARTQPERVPLTDSWILERYAQSWVFETAKQWVRMTEAAHGIK